MLIQNRAKWKKCRVPGISCFMLSTGKFEIGKIGVVFFCFRRLRFSREASKLQSWFVGLFLNSCISHFIFSGNTFHELCYNTNFTRVKCAILVVGQLSNALPYLRCNFMWSSASPPWQTSFFPWLKPLYNSKIIQRILFASTVTASSSINLLNNWRGNYYCCGKYNRLNLLNISCYHNLLKSFIYYNIFCEI